MVTIKPILRCERSNIFKTFKFNLEKSVKLLLKAVFLNTRETLRVNINQKDLFYPVESGFIQLVPMEPEMIMPSTFIDHVA